MHREEKMRLGEIKLLPFQSAPAGWLECDGSSLPIEDYDLLFVLVDRYSSDGRSHFELPDLRHCAPISGLRYFICLYGMFPRLIPSEHDINLKSQRHPKLAVLRLKREWQGEIKLFPFRVAPRDWHECDGSSLPIDQNRYLCFLVDRNGNDGRIDFELPDLRHCVPISGLHYFIRLSGIFPQLVPASDEHESPVEIPRERNSDIAISRMMLDTLTLTDGLFNCLLQMTGGKKNIDRARALDILDEIRRYQEKRRSILDQLGVFLYKLEIRNKLAFLNNRERWSKDNETVETITLSAEVANEIRDQRLKTLSEWYEDVLRQPAPFGQTPNDLISDQSRRISKLEDRLSQVISETRKPPNLKRRIVFVLIIVIAAAVWYHFR
jgi:microcystin-dependent protein